MHRDVHATSLSPTVLHVAESFSAGVGAAIQQYVSRTPELRHLLIYSERPESPVEPEWLAPFASTQKMARGHVRRVRQIAQFFSLSQPDIVHLHSSYAGAYGRLAVSRRRARIVYTPHCYAFERRDIGRFPRALIRLVEGLLNVNTTIVAACSPHEASLARCLPKSVNSRYLPSVAQPTTRPDTDWPPRVVGSGRLSPQKDPSYFLEVVRAFRQEYPETVVHFEWIGNTDPSWNRDFEDRQVEITGWLPRDEARERLSQAAAYVHCARWEGFPVSILDAIDAGVPLAVRDLPYASSLPRDCRFEDASQAAHRIASCLQESGDYRSLPEWVSFMGQHSAQEQLASLRAAYGLEE